MTEEIMKNLYRLPVTLPDSPLKLLNSYLIKGGERNLLIDTGYKRPECLDSLQGQLAELNVDMSKTDILLTHLHADHTGLAPSVAVPGTRVYLSRAELPWVLKGTREDLWKRDNVEMVRFGFDPEIVRKFLKHAASRDLSPDAGFQDYLPIDDGQAFTCGEYTLRAVLTPGHTPAHMCFWMEEQKTMFTGDHVLFDISPNITSWVNVDDSLGDYLNSLRMIDRYDVQTALPGHRETGDFHARIADLLDHHEQRLAECLDIVKRKPCQSVYDITGQMSWRIRCNSWEDFPLGQKWFAVGEAASHLRHLETRGLVTADRSCEVIRYRAV